MEILNTMKATNDGNYTSSDMAQTREKKSSENQGKVRQVEYSELSIVSDVLYFYRYESKITDLKRQLSNAK